jgi:hypothetical protein
MRFLNKRKIWIAMDIHTKKIIFVIDSACGEREVIEAVKEALSKQPLQSMGYVYAASISKLHNPGGNIIIHSENYYVVRIGQGYVKLTRQEAESLQAAISYVISYVKRTDCLASAVATLPEKIKTAIRSHLQIDANVELSLIITKEGYFLKHGGKETSFDFGRFYNAKEVLISDFDEGRFYG